MIVNYILSIVRTTPRAKKKKKTRFQKKRGKVLSKGGMCSLKGSLGVFFFFFF